MKRILPFLAILVLFNPFDNYAQTGSISRQWNNIVLEAIRNDYARPTVHARNLFHHSIICYDAWAAYDPSKALYFLGETHNGYTCDYDTIPIPGDVGMARTIAISYASYRFLQNRYSASPDFNETMVLANDLMNSLGLDPTFASTDYMSHGAAALGNYLAAQIQAYGYTDGSNEQNDFNNQTYVQLNPPLEMAQPGNPDIQDPNHWQPLELETLIDQSGNLITTTQPHLSPEWGNVHPFALDTADAVQLTRDGMTFNVYFDTMHPALLTPGDSTEWDSFYKWNHTLVSIWQAHLDPNDGVMWDISPASIGNNTWYPNPNDETEYPLFYDLLNGGDPGTGHAINPVTGAPYTPQIVPRADYARVLAEFWADGIDSETPPGHWFEIYHYVTDQPSFERKWNGTGPELDSLEYDVKAHLALGGTVHDAAIAAWSLKGYYDYLRPVSAIRFMADMGQSSDTSALSYHPDGIPLLPGLVEIVQAGDTLAGQWNENVGKIKLYTWRGHDYIGNPTVDIAEVGWILAENWWPYQRPTFVTPPFAGFVSGHSTFSRAAAHTMEFMTGSPFFPGGMGEFIAPMNEYLKFEEGPSDTVRLQWATYIDASDQCSLSRIWGGIHPPIDDIPGRMIGDVVGPKAALLADSLFDINISALTYAHSNDSMITIADIGSAFQLDFGFSASMDTTILPTFTLLTSGLSSAVTVQQIEWVDTAHLIVLLQVPSSSTEFDETYMELSGLQAESGSTLADYTFKDLFLVDTKRPMLLSASSNSLILSDTSVTSGLEMTFEFDEPCDTSSYPLLTFSASNYMNASLNFSTVNSGWQNDSIFTGVFSFTDFDELVTGITVSTQFVQDDHGNPMDSVGVGANFIIDTENPTAVNVYPSDLLLNQEDLSSPSLFIDVSFSEPMDVTTGVLAQLDSNGTQFSSVQYNGLTTTWLSSDSVRLDFLIFPDSNNLTALDLWLDNLKDTVGNAASAIVVNDILWSDMKSPEVVDVQSSSWILNDSLLGGSNYFVDIFFSEPVDTSVLPYVNHTASQTISGSIQYNVPLSHYLDSLTYRAYFQLLDENIEVSLINLEVDFVEDVSGNSMVSYTEPNFIVLDTRNPQVIGLYANTSVLDQWGQSWEVIAVFDEPMRQSLNPVVQLSTIPVNFPMVSNGWVNTTNYGFEHQLLGIPAQSLWIDLELEGAKDLAGNDQVAINEVDFLRLNPLLSVEELAGETFVLFPNPVSTGDFVVIQGLESSDETLDIQCLNALGQELPSLKLMKKGGHYVSEPLALSSGWYLLKFGKKQFKLIVR